MDIVEICLDHGLDDIIGFGIVLLVEKLLSFDEFEIKASCTKISRRVL